MTNKDIALYYLKKYSLVPLPCMGEGDSKGKTPLVKWREIQALPSESQVEEWFNKFPDANIGFKTGKVSGILVLDNDGVQINDPIPLTPIATSREGHFHYYFKNPDFYVPPSVSKIGEHLDIRCDQAFIVAPPSKHFNKTTGEIDGEYTWVENFSPKDLPFAECPEWLIAKIKNVLSKSVGFDWATALNVGIGARDDTLTRAAASLVAKGFDYDMALSILRGINNTYTPPLSDDLVISKLTSAINFVKSKQEEQEIKEQTESRDFFIGKTVLLKDLDPEIIHKEWLWENFLAKRHITLLVAYWKAGKSTMLRTLFAAMEREEEFAGEPTKKCNILVVTEEPEEDWVDKREEFELDQNTNLYILSRPFKGKPTLKQWPEVITRLVKECNENKIDLLIFDTISTFFPINKEKESDEWLNALLPLYEFTRLDLAVLLVHHFRKGAGDEAQAFRGSGVLGSFPSNIIEFIRDPEGYNNRRVIKTYGRFSQAMPRTLIELQSDMKYKTLGDPVVVSKTHRIAKILSILKESREPLCSKDILNIWTVQMKSMDGVMLSLRAIQDYLKELLATNSIVLADERVVNKKKTPFYALKEGFALQKGMEFLYNNDTPLASVNEANLGTTGADTLPPETMGSLASVNPKNVPATDARGVSMLIREKTWRDPRIDH